MRCKDAKAIIKQQRAEIRLLTERLSQNAPVPERVYGFNELEIVVRPRRGRSLVQYEYLGIDLRVCGDPDMIPTVCNVKRINRCAMDIVKEHRHDFIKRIGEITAQEILDLVDRRGSA